MGERPDESGSTVYNALSNACLGPLHDGTVLERERQRVADSLAIQLLFYDKIVCLSDDLSVVPILVDLVGPEYTCHLLTEGSLRLLRARAVAAMQEDQIVFLIPRGRGRAKFRDIDWARAAFASDNDEAAAWVSREGVGGPTEANIRDLKDALIAGTTDIEPKRVFGPATQELEEEVADFNSQVKEAGLRQQEVVRIKSRKSGLHVLVGEEDVDRFAIMGCVLGHIGRKAALAVPGLADLNPQATDVAIADGGESGGRTNLQAPPLPQESRRALEGVMQTLNMPDVGELVRLGRLKPEALVDLRESDDCKEFRKWYVKSILSNPKEAVARGAELVASRVGKSTGQRAVEFVLGQAASAGAAIGGLVTGGASAIGLGSVATMLHSMLAENFADWLFKRKHPMKFVERLREASRS